MFSVKYSINVGVLLMSNLLYRVCYVQSHNVVSSMLQAKVTFLFRVGSLKYKRH